MSVLSEGAIPVRGSHTLPDPHDLPHPARRTARAEGGLTRGPSVTRGVDVPFYALLIACAYGLKNYYSSASPESLRWVLAPTAWLVDLASEGTFVFERHVGYVSTEAGTAIVPACAGVNFLIMLFGMQAASFVGRFRQVSSKILWVACSATTAYLATVVVNAARIRLGMSLRASALPFDADQVHRVEGVLIYLGVLTLLYSGTHALFARSETP